MVLLLLIRCWLLLPLWDSVIVLCFVARYIMSILVLQSSWWGRESWLLCLVCLPGVSWLLCGSSSRCHGFVCSLWLWYFLIILTYYFSWHLQYSETYLFDSQVMLLELITYVTVNKFSVMSGRWSISDQSVKKSFWVKEKWSGQQIQGLITWPSFVALTLSLCNWAIDSAHHLPEMNIWPNFNANLSKCSSDMERT